MNFTKSFKIIDMRIKPFSTRNFTNIIMNTIAFRIKVEKKIDKDGNNWAIIILKAK